FGGAMASPFARPAGQPAIAHGIARGSFPGLSRQPIEGFESTMNRELAHSSERNLGVAVGPLRHFEHYDDDPFDHGGDEGGIDLRLIWRILWGHKLFVLASAALGIALAIAISLLATP